MAEIHRNRYAKLKVFTPRKLEPIRLVHAKSTRKIHSRTESFVGRTFNRWTVIEEAGRDRWLQRLWKCRCNCGREKIVTSHRLTKGLSTSCGCDHLGDLRGQKFGRYTVVRPAKNNQWGERRWWCVCECGEERIVTNYALKSGRTKSCGCLFIEQITKHGHTSNANCGGNKSTEYRIWGGMKQRCENTNYKRYADYGGRGIGICARWSTSFEAFLADMGSRPSTKHTIDRIDNDKHYSCGKCPDCKTNGWVANCRWATKEVQAANTRHPKYYFEGEERTIADISRRSGIPYTSLKKRLRMGYDAAEAVRIARSRRQVIETFLWEGEQLTLPAIAERSGVPYPTIKWRLNHGYNLVEATK